MKIERLISQFDKSSEELLKETNVDNLSLNVLKEIFKPAEKDPLMYNPYTITNKEADKLKDLVDIKFDFNLYLYQLDCFQL